MNPVSQYISLCKPRVVLLLLVTAVVGSLLSLPYIPDLSVLFGAFFGIGLCTSAAAAMNQLLEAKIDQKMLRTSNRPIAVGSISQLSGWIFAGGLTVAGCLVLWFFTNPLTMWLTLLGIVGYSFIYTLLLKPLTPYNIVIGGVSGALPPLLGWTSVTNQIDATALVLVGLVYCWTPAHFWALALDRKDDYAKAGIPMLPVTHGDSFTRIQIVLYATLTACVSFMYFAISGSGIVYLAGAIILNLWLIAGSLRLLMKPESYAPIKYFTVTNFYLMLLFALMLIDHMLFGQLNF